MTRICTALLAATLLAAGLPASAIADDVKPGPDCLGVMITDEAGDQAATGTDEASKPPDNLDLTNVFVRYEYDAQHHKHLTLNFQVTNLDKTMYLTSTDATWYAALSYKNRAGKKSLLYAGAQVDSLGSVAYFLGSNGPPSPLNDAATTTPGRFLEGPNGVIEVELPVDTFDGATFLGGQEGSYALAVAHHSAALGHGSDHTSNAPEETALQVCGDTPPPPAAPLTELGAAPVAAPASAEGAASPQAPSGASAVSDTRPTVTLLTRVIASRKAGRVALRLKASSPLRRVVATLKRGGRVVGSGRLASLSGTGVVQLRLKRGLARGNYTLSLRAVDAAGGTYTQSYRVRAR